MPLRTIFRNEDGNVFISDPLNKVQVECLVLYAKEKGLHIFSDKTETWESVYWNKDEKAICGCTADKAEKAVSVSYGDFMGELNTPKKKVKGGN